MKCRESAETRFGKVWCRLELCLRGKRPFEFRRKIRKRRSKGGRVIRPPPGRLNKTPGRLNRGGTIIKGFRVRTGCTRFGWP